MGGLTLPIDITNQVVCSAGQTDGHIVAPDHTTSQTDVQLNRTGPQATQLMPLSGITGYVLVLHDLTGLVKAICKSRPAY